MKHRLTSSILVASALLAAGISADQSELAVSELAPDSTVAPAARGQFVPPAIGDPMGPLVILIGASAR
jgi:hypothetical protein